MSNTGRRIRIISNNGGQGESFEERINAIVEEEYNNGYDLVDQEMSEHGFTGTGGTFSSTTVMLVFTRRTDPESA